MTFIDLDCIAEIKEQNEVLQAREGDLTILLRPVNLKDAPLAAEWRAKTRKNFYADHPATPEYWKNFLKRAYIDAPNALMMMVIDPATSTPIGHTSLYDMTEEGAEYGRTVRGVEGVANGAITLATKQLVKLGFEDVGLDRIYLGVFAHNDRAIKAYRNAGFVSRGDVALEEVNKYETSNERAIERWKERPDLGDKSTVFSTHMEITREHYDHLAAQKFYDVR